MSIWLGLTPEGVECELTFALRTSSGARTVWSSMPATEATSEAMLDGSTTAWSLA